MTNSILNVCDKLHFGKQDGICIPFLGQGNVWIRNSYSPDVIALARHIIHEAIQRTAPGQLSIIGFDSDYSGLFAPFAEISSGETKRLSLLSSAKELDSTLNFLGQHIQAVQNVIQGRYDDLTAFRQYLSQPVEEYKLVVLFMNLSDADVKFLAKLHTLMIRGPAAGVSFIVITTNNTIGGKGEIGPRWLLKHISILGVSSGVVQLLDATKPIDISYVLLDAEFNAIAPSNIVHNCKVYLNSLKSAALPVVSFNDINDQNINWNQSSEDGLTFSIGKYGVNDVEITIGDEVNQRHNALITGAVGQGKSNLLSVIIHSLCQRYSPNELNLYLLDFKEGVSLKPFVNIGQEEYLPHAKVVGLESDIVLGCAVLEYLYSEYLRRLKIFKTKDVKSLSEFRKKCASNKMPRIVAIIDEFQLMFGDDTGFGQKVVELLEKSVRLFRAAGIHFILASQSISGNITLSSKKDSIFSQVPIRIAHKNSINESHNTLGIANSAAAYLRAREAIVNVDYGEISQNRKTIIAWADESVLGPLRRKWWNTARDTCPPPYIFESEKIISAASAMQDALSVPKSVIPYALLGEQISITGDKLTIPMPNEPGRNIALIGSPGAERNNAEGILQGIALSLASQHKKGDASFLFCDLRDKEDSMQNRYPIFTQAIQSLGFVVEDIPRKSLLTKLESLIAESPVDGKKTYIFVFGLDGLDYVKSPYGSQAPLKAFVDTAPEKGIHLIGWWIKPSNFKVHVAGLEGSDAFNTKIFLRVDENSIRSLTNPFTKWDSPDNRALLSDEVEYASEVVFIPYSPMSSIN